jgi:clan AA aspartic protease (TIGR02281 family)
VTLNGVHLRAVIDTGAFHTTIFRDSARRVGLGDAAKVGAGTMTGVGARRVHVDVRLATAMTIGDLTVNSMPIVVADQRHTDNVDMLLGFDFVTRVHLWVSRSSGTLIMQFPPQASPAAPP